LVVAPFTFAVSCDQPLADPPVATASEFPSPCAYSFALDNEPVTNASTVVAHSFEEPSVGVPTACSLAEYTPDNGVATVPLYEFTTAGDSVAYDFASNT